jgi:hypothetical protein
MSNSLLRIMRLHFGRLFLIVLGVAALLGEPSLAQDSAYQRDFTGPASAVQAAVQSVTASSKGRLPTLAGFVQSTEQALDRYERGYYECTFLVSPANNGRTTVRVTAKLTAWYNDADATKSGYRVLLSNGRLEADVLDRIAEKLGPGASIAPLVSVPVSGVSRQPQDKASSTPDSGTRSTASGSDMVSPHTDGGEVALPPGTTLESLKARSEEDEKQSATLSSYIKNLEEIQHNQSHPNDLAAVRKNKTPVFAKPADSAQLLLNADAQDEFQILGLEGPWVHVQISGVSRGWIRRSQLEMPTGFAEASDTVGGAPAATAIFKVAKEGSSSFSGNWAPLKGKAVRFEWVEPASPALPTTRQEKLTFAKSVFLNAYQSATSSQPVAEGIVIVFDSADGGQVAATMASVKELANRTISDSAFWRQCSLDPPESFLSNNNP